MLGQHQPVARVLPKGRIKQELSGTQNKNKQKDRTLKLGDAKKRSNAGNSNIDAIMQNNRDTSSCKNLYDTMIEIVEAVKWALSVHYREVNIRGFIGQ